MTIGRSLYSASLLHSSLLHFFHSGLSSTITPGTSGTSALDIWSSYQVSLQPVFLPAVHSRNPFSSIISPPSPNPPCVSFFASFFFTQAWVAWVDGNPLIPIWCHRLMIHILVVLWRMSLWWWCPQWALMPCYLYFYVQILGLCWGMFPFFCFLVIVVLQAGSLPLLL